jgi:hypothetical protein
MALKVLKPIQKSLMRFTIVGTSELITHAWSEKAKIMMREKQQGKKTKDRPPRDPQAEYEAAKYYTADGQVGIPGLAVKAAMITAAHKDLGIEKTLVKKAVFLHLNDPNKVLPLQGNPPGKLREDMVRVGQGSADLRYRPEFSNWRVNVCFEVDTELLTEDDVAALVDRAGFGTGICEWRPEKGGEFGRFKIATDEPFTVEPLEEARPSGTAKGTKPKGKLKPVAKKKKAAKAKS